MITKINKNAIRTKRHERMRDTIKGTAATPRLNVYRSLTHIYAQVIDDVSGNTLVSANTVEKEVAAKANGKTKTEAAKLVGETVAKRAVKAGIKSVVFDRGGYLYAGRIAAVAEAARAAGLEF